MEQFQKMNIPYTLYHPCHEEIKVTGMIKGENMKTPKNSVDQRLTPPPPPPPQKKKKTKCCQMLQKAEDQVWSFFIHRTRWQLEYAGATTNLKFVS